MSNAAEIIGKQVLRGEVLNIVCGAEPYGAGTETIHAFLKKKGYAVDKDGIAALCNYLAGKGLIKIERAENKVLDIKRDIAQITPEGVDVLEGTVTVEGIELAD